jgi:nucleoside-diphosphate-sugar epimerase
LGQRGYRVRVLSRRTPEPSLFSLPVEVVRGDITDLGSVAKAAQGVNVVFHLAARLHEPGASAELKGQYEDVNVVGTRNVVESASQAGVGRIVFFSTICVYGATSGRLADESTPPRPDSIYAETKLQAERLAQGSRASDGRPLVSILRMAAVYGPRMKGNYLRLAQALAKGRFVPIGAGENRRTLVHERDAVEAALMAAEHPEAGGRVFNVTDGAVHAFREILVAMSTGLGRRPPRLAVPEGLARGAARIVDGISSALGRGTRAGALLGKYLEDVAVAGILIERELGFTPHVDLRAGWQDALAPMRTR